MCALTVSSPGERLRYGALSLLLASVFLVPPCVRAQSAARDSRLGSAASRSSSSERTAEASASTRMTPEQYMEWSKKRREEQQKKTTATSQPQKAQQPARRTYRKPTQAAPARTGARPSVKIEPLKISADPTAAILYLDPMDVIAQKGETFVTKLVLSNPKAQPFNRVFIALTYDSGAVRPMSISEVALRDLLSSTSLAQVYESKGLVLYEATLKQKADLTDKTLLDINWRAIGDVRSSAVEFAAFDGKATSLSLDSSDMLGDPFIANDGVVGARVTVLGPEEQFELADFGTQFYDVGETLGIGAVTGDITLALHGAKRKVKVGEQFLVDVYYNNPHKARADAVNLVIRFDPEVLRVVDYDDDNWIETGVNIFDGAYHERFPFDYLIRNNVDNTKGEIVYQMGVSKPDILTGSGTLATIKFRAKATSDKATVYFAQPKRAGHLGTTVEYLGQDVLGNVTDIHDGTRNIALEIVSR